MSRRDPLGNRGARAAFFAYHSIAAPGPPLLSLAPERFEAHLDLLRRRGFRSGRLEHLAALRRGEPVDGRLAFLSFDDGYADNHDVAAALLRERGMTALFFVLPPLLDAGAPLAWPEVAGALADHPGVMRSMTWAMAERMAEQGMEFGAHTLTHPHLPELSDEQLAEELLDSRRAIAERLGACDSLAYPFGEWDPRVERAAAAAGYRWAFTLPFHGQRHARPLAIPRVAIDHRDDARRFAVKLAAPTRQLLLGTDVKRRLRPLRDAALGFMRRV